MATKPIKLIVSVLALVALIAGLWFGLQDKESSAPSERVKAPLPGEEAAKAPQDETLTVPHAIAKPDAKAQLELSEEDALKASIKSISCFPEMAGKDVLPREELAPSLEGIQAMEGCLDLVGARFPQQSAIELTTVFYLSPDGSVFETGVGADVATLEAWDLLEPCAREYWLANPPKLRASDEKSFSCVYSWSMWSLRGAVHRIGAQVPSVLSGRGAMAFGTRVTGQ